MDFESPLMLMEVKPTTFYLGNRRPGDWATGATAVSLINYLVFIVLLIIFTTLPLPLRHHKIPPSPTELVPSGPGEES